MLFLKTTSAFFFKRTASWARGRTCGRTAGRAATRTAGERSGGRTVGSIDGKVAKRNDDELSNARLP